MKKVKKFYNDAENEEIVLLNEEDFKKIREDAILTLYKKVDFFQNGKIIQNYKYIGCIVKNEIKEIRFSAVKDYKIHSINNIYIGVDVFLCVDANDLKVLGLEE